MFLENELYTAYFKNGFGKILKSEIDLYVFHYFLLKELNCINNDSGTVSEIPYLKIEKKDLYNLASIANISISKLQNLIENDFNVFCKNKNLDYKTELYKIIQTERFKLNFEKKQKTIRLSITNPILRQLLVKEINLQEGTPDFSFNKDIIEIEFTDFLQLLDVTDSFYEKFKDKFEQNNKKSKIEQISNWFLSTVGTELVSNIVAFLISIATNYFVK